MKERYNQSELHQVQQNQLYILDSFKEFCDKHHLHYTLDFGTVLGSIRHKGFIPWDDDIDVAMLRVDYDKFLSLAGARIKEDLFVQSFENDPEFIHCFTRIRLDNSLALQEDWKYLDCHHGIFIDIFPYDTIPESEKLRVEHQKTIYRYQESKLHKVRMMRADYGKVSWLDYHAYPLAMLPLHVLNRMQTQVITKYNTGFSDNDRVAHMTQGFKSYMDSYRTVYEHRHSVLGDFEGSQYPIPLHAEQILTRMYGEYMEYPPKPLREPHHDVIKYRVRKDICEYYETKEALK